MVYIRNGSGFVRRATWGTDSSALPERIREGEGHLARAVALQKRKPHLDALRSRVYQARVRAAQKFELDNAHVIRDFNFQRGSLVLLRNTRIEKSLNRKMRPRYLGPLVVVSRNAGGAYILCELDGAVMDRPVAAFRVVPYFPRHSIPLPDDFEDITPDRLRDMVEAHDTGDDDDTEPDAPDDSDRGSDPDSDPEDL